MKLEILDAAGFKEKFREAEGFSLASAPEFFEELKKEPRAEKIKKDLEEKALVLTRSIQIIEGPLKGAIVHANKYGARGVHNIDIPFKDKSPVKVMPEFGGVSLEEIFTDKDWMNYFQALSGLPFSYAGNIRNLISRIHSPEKTAVITPRLEKRNGRLVTMVTFSRVDEYLVIGSIYDPNTTIGHPFVEVNQ